MEIKTKNAHAGFLENSFYLLGLSILILTAYSCNKNNCCCPPSIVTSELTTLDTDTKAFADIYKDISTLIFMDSNGDSVALHSTGAAQVDSFNYKIGQIYCDADSTEFRFKAQRIKHLFRSIDGDSLSMTFQPFVKVRREPSFADDDSYLISYLRDNVFFEPETNGNFRFQISLKQGESYQAGGAVVSPWEDNEGSDIEYFDELILEGRIFTEVYKEFCCSSSVENYYSLNKGFVAFFDKENQKYWILKSIN